MQAANRFPCGHCHNAPIPSIQYTRAAERSSQSLPEPLQRFLVNNLLPSEICGSYTDTDFLLLTMSRPDNAEIEKNRPYPQLTACFSKPSNALAVHYTLVSRRCYHLHFWLDQFEIVRMNPVCIRHCLRQRTTLFAIANPLANSGFHTRQ
jgi:hypothetical protein